jgi:hypothetical protein
MSTIRERVYIEAPYSQAAGALERRLGLEPGQPRGTCTLTLIVPAAQGRELARSVTVLTERTGGAADYRSAYSIRWDAGRTDRGVPTPGFAGSLTLGSGEDYGECALQIEGVYEPPGGVPGKIFDQIVGRRIAHATLAALLDGVGRELARAHEAVEAAKRTP